MEPLTFKMDLPIPRDRVWEAFTDSAQLTRWLCAEADVEPVLGGAYELLFEETELAGRILSIDHPRLLHVGSIDPKNTFEIVVELFPTLDGTRLEITHSFAQSALENNLTTKSLEKKLDESLRMLAYIADSKFRGIIK